uniref:Viral ankyrin n=1 Tax=Glyptapanteles flavicoxis TaxID=463051 RepID=B7S8H6_9HYME|nr:viral ankyrin [Glyptapanteles flavicoxis]
MESNKFLQMLSTRNTLGDNFFHEACKASWILLLRRAENMIDEPIPTILTTRNYNGEQCTHLIVSTKDIYAQEMMKIVLNLGADVNGQEACGGFTPLHLCVWKKNYALAEWLCKVPGINLEAVNYANQTVYQLARECDEYQIMEIVKKAGAKCELKKVKKK